MMTTNFTAAASLARTNGTLKALYRGIDSVTLKLSTDPATLARVMRNAWEMRREAAARLGCKVSAVHWGECLKAAWAEERQAQREARLPELATEATLAAWAALTGEEQMTWLANNVRRAAKNLIGNSVADEYDSRHEIPAFYSYGIEFDEFTHEAYLTLADKLSRLLTTNRRRVAAGKSPKTLGSLVYMSAQNALGKVYRQWQSMARADVREVADEKGRRHSVVEEFCADPRASREFGKVEASAWLDSLGEIDRRIVECRLLGMTERETAKACGYLFPGGKVSHVSIHKRLVKLATVAREALAG